MMMMIVWNPRHHHHHHLLPSFASHLQGQGMYPSFIPLLLLIYTPRVVNLTRGASQVKLQTLAKHGIIRVGDVIAYKRSFASSETIEKDTIVCIFIFSSCLSNNFFFFFRFKQSIPLLSILQYLLNQDRKKTFLLIFFPMTR